MKAKLCLYAVPFPWVTSYYEMIDIAADLGLPGVEGFNKFELSQPDLDAALDIRCYAEKKGICFPCMSVFADISGKDNRHEIERMKLYTQVAAILGAPYLHHTIVPALQDPDTILQNREQLFQSGLDAVRQIFDHAAKYNVMTVFEDQGYLFNGVEGFERFLLEVDRKVGVVADMGNILQTDQLPEPFITAFGHRIVHTHIKDAKYKKTPQLPENWIPTLSGGGFYPCSLGEGIVDVKKCISLLRAQDYDGWYALEFAAGSGGRDAFASCISKIESWIQAT